MYCVGVPNGIVFVMRNGKPLWCGNTGGLGTPEHQRCTAGDVHRAHLGILFIDEIKNLIGMEAITLLTVLEDGQLPIALRSQFHGGDTAAMAVATEPIPSMFFLIAAGNLDSLPNIHPALLDRIQGYGKVVYMSNDMPNTPENRRRYVQFIAQEIKRFNLIPFSRDACIASIDEARRKSGKNSRLTCKFRPMISVVKTASVLAMNEGKVMVERKHVEEALREHCKTIGLQVMEKHIENAEGYLIIDPKAKPKMGQIHGLAVSSINEETRDYVGSVLCVRASCVPKGKKKKEGYFQVTGVNVKDSSYVQHSIAKVRHLINQLYEIDLSQDYFTHVDFAQEHGVEGPSAGVTMTLALISCLTNKKIRQDVAVTGEINIGCEDKILVTPIGGAHEKILAAQRMGFKKVLIPMKNFERDIDPKDYTIKVIGCATLDEYTKHCFVE
jgi:Lon-like ATP-dependent protease